MSATAGRTQMLLAVADLGTNLLVPTRINTGELLCEDTRRRFIGAIEKIHKRCHAKRLLLSQKNAYNDKYKTKAKMQLHCDTDKEKKLHKLSKRYAAKTARKRSELNAVLHAYDNAMASNSQRCYNT